MRERRETCAVQCGNQQSRGDPGRLGWVVVLHLATVGQLAELLQEHGDQVRRRLEKGLVLVGPERFQRCEPFLRCPVRIELAFLDLGRLADLLLGLGARDHHEMPGLQVGPARRRVGHLQRCLDEVAWYGAIRELAHRASPAEVRIELREARAHFLDRVLAILV